MARNAWPLVAVAAVLAAASASIAWPGIAAYDATRQYEQAVTGRYDDWHPPVMARLWSLFLRAGLWGTAPMLVVQLALYWAGLALLAIGLRRARAPVAGWAALLIGLSPPPIDWLIVVDKDAQMIAAMIAATGLVAYFRLARRSMPAWAAAIAALLLIYAVLLRANAAFAAIPLALGLADWPGTRRWWTRAIVMFGATVLAIAVSGPVNHRLLGAEVSGVRYTLPMFDLAGIAHRAPLATMPGLPPADWAVAEQRHCYTPFYWDPFADPARCGAMGNALVSDAKGPPPILRDWLHAIATHPLAYAEHRAAHLNATLRILTPADEHSAAAPWSTPETIYGIGSRGTAASRTLWTMTAAVERTPAGSPAVWLLLAALIGWVLLATPRQPARALALVLILSGMTMMASFAVVSIASDLRYHLWPIAATTIAAVLLAACRGVPRGRLALAAGAMIAIAAVSIALRAGAPPLGY